MKSIVTFLVLAITSTCIFAQEDSKKKKFTVEGSVDTYFRQNLSGPNGEDAIAPNTSFANRNGFAIGMANVIGSFESENGKVGAVADLVFGPRGEEAVFLSGPSSNIVNQLYVYWNVSDKVKLTLGNFNTFLGYEVISPTLNFNYSTSYMFSYGPFSHTGIKADFTLSEDWSAMVVVLNQTDATEFNFDNDYTLGAQLGYKTTYLNFLYGKQGGSTESTFQVDLTTGHDLSDDFYLGLNATYNDTDGASFYGVALYPQYKTSESFTLGLRGEYFAETEGGAGAIGGYDEEGDASVLAVTLTGSYTVGDLTIKPEFRLDSASEDTFLDTDLEPNSSLSSFLIAGIYKF
ncbi:porin [Dokdonia sp. R86516]|uniref:porin n=1 Tax=Dokdonia sp. R86516 TaxID=3093856 RepID=UPI0037CAB542